jgi:hypothetical protein
MPRKRTPKEAWEADLRFRAVQIAHQRNTLAAQRAPLFAAAGALAEVHEEVTPGEVFAELAAAACRSTRSSRADQEKADRLRLICRGLCGDDLVFLSYDQEAERSLPPVPRYHLEFWHRTANELLRGR